MLLLNKVKNSLKQIKRTKLVERYNLEDSKNDTNWTSTSKVKTINSNSGPNAVTIDLDSIPQEVEGRAVQLRATIDDIIYEDPKLMKNSANIKLKIKDRLKNKGLEHLYELEKDKIPNMIRSWIREFKIKNEDSAENEIKFKIGTIKKKIAKNKTTTNKISKELQFDHLIKKDDNSQSTKVETNFSKYVPIKTEMFSDKVIRDPDDLRISTKPFWMNESSSEGRQDEYMFT